MATKQQSLDRILWVGGAAIHLVETPGDAPRGPAMLLLHGAGMDHRVWEAPRAALGARSVHVLAPDLPGHGRSEGPALGNISALAEWVLRLADGLDLQRLALAGHSMGALAALEAGARLGARSVGLALIGATPRMTVNAALLAAAQDDLPRAAEMISSWGFGAAAQASGLAEAGRRMIAASARGVLAADLMACAQYDGAADATKRIGCPAVVIAGAKDRMTPALHGRALARMISGARFLEVPEVGHMLPQEAPKAVTDAVLGLMA